MHSRDASFSKVDKGWLRQRRGGGEGGHGHSDGDPPGRWKLIPPVDPCTATLGKMPVHKGLRKCHWKPEDRSAGNRSGAQGKSARSGPQTWTISTWKYF